MYDMDSRPPFSPFFLAGGLKKGLAATAAPMANANNDRFSYQAMSNVVLSQDRRSRGRAGRDAPPGTTGEAGSLSETALSSPWGTRLAPAQRVALAPRSSPTSAVHETRPARGLRSAASSAAFRASTSALRPPPHLRRRLGPGERARLTSPPGPPRSPPPTELPPQHFPPPPWGTAHAPLKPWPRTKTYSPLWPRYPDGTSEDLLASFAEQALIILKSDEFINVRRPELAQLFSRKDTGDGAFLDTYNTLTEFGRRISDFDVDQAKEAGAAELEAAQPKRASSMSAWFTVTMEGRAGMVRAQAAMALTPETRT